VPLLEETGLVIPVSAEALKTACRQSEAWRQQGLAGLRLAVNLSPRQFRQKGLLDSVTKALDAANMSPEHMQLEVTEGLLITNTAETTSILRQLQRMGLQIAIDDFGTGYSSLNYLRRFPFTAIKVDKSFVQEISSDDDGAAIVGAVIELAHSLRLKVIAEGVEQRDQLHLLAERGCDEVQGFYYSRPISGEESTRWLLDYRDNLDSKTEPTT